MKNIFKRNQIVITALAIMIAAAFYLNYAGKIDMKDDLYQTSSESANEELEVVADISEEDIVSLDSDEEAEYIDELASEIVEDTVSDVSSTEIEAETGTETVTSEGEPGEAVLTSGTVSTGDLAQAKLSREQIRSKNKELLMEIINNEEIAQEQKQSAIDSMVAITEIAEKYASVEILLESKGFENVVVSISEDSADVIVGINELSDAKKAQIEDIMKRKTGVSPENIIITPVACEE